jgi:xylulokinase
MRALRCSAAPSSRTTWTPNLSPRFPPLTPAFIGVDVGTTGVKTIAISPNGEVIARAEEGYPLSTPRQGWSEQDPQDWWRATQATLEAMTAAGVREVGGIGLSGQMHGLVCLDEHDRVLRPAILWNDQRTGAECAEIEQRVGLQRLIQLTGNRALTGFTAPKLLWLRRHEPEVYSRIAHILLPKDYVRLRLTGERAIDVADASGTLLFDVAQRRWSEEVIKALEVNPSWLPRVLESPEVSGRTAGGVAVAAGAGDQAAAALGVGVDKPGPLSVVLGTSGVVFAALPAFAADPEARVHAFCHAVPGAWHAMGVMLSAAGSMQWFRDELAAGVSFAELDAEAAGSVPGGEGLIFLPYLAGERTPHADPDARGAFVGLSVRHDRGALVRAVLEGVAYGLRDSLELLTALGVRADAGRASGGGARSRLWLQVVASVLGLPLELTVLEEGSAYGAALLGGVAGGAFGDVHQAVDSCVRVREVIEPDRAWQEAYVGGYERYRELYPALRTHFQRSAAAR